MVCDKPLVHTSEQARIWSQRSRLGRRLRRDVQLLGLSDGQAGPRHGRAAASSARSARSSSSTARAGSRRCSSRPATSRPSGAPIPPAPAPPARWATSARTPRTWARRSPAGTWPVCADLDQLRPGPAARRRRERAAAVRRRRPRHAHRPRRSRSARERLPHPRLRDQGRLALAPGGAERSGSPEGRRAAGAAPRQ